MKILFIQIIRGLSGSEKYIIETMPLLKERGVDCEFLCVHLPQDGDKYRLVTNPLEEQSINVHYIETKSTLNYALLKNINKVVKKGNYDLVNSHLIHADMWMAMVKILFNRKLVLVSGKHGYDDVFTQKFGHDPTKRLYNAYYFSALFAERFINRSFAISTGLCKLFEALKISNPKKMDRIYYGFRTNYTPNPDSKKLRTSPQQLCIVGRLLKLKGHEFAFRALQIVLQKFPETQLVIIGDGVERENLEQLTKDLKLENHIQFKGFQKNAMDYMAQSDIVLVPSKSEGFGIVLIEAFEVKIPAIAFDVPASNELIEDGKSGYLIKPFEVEDLANRIIELLGDEAKRTFLANNAYQRLKNYFTPERMADETIAFYKKALNG